MPHLATLDTIGSVSEADAYELTHGLDLGRYLADLTPAQKKWVLGTQKVFLDSLIPEALAEFNLTPEKLAKFRREASGG